MSDSSLNSCGLLASSIGGKPVASPISRGFYPYFELGVNAGPARGTCPSDRAQPNFLILLGPAQVKDLEIAVGWKRTHSQVAIKDADLERLACQLEELL